MGPDKEKTSVVQIVDWLYHHPRQYATRWKLYDRCWQHLYTVDGDGCIVRKSDVYGPYGKFKGHHSDKPELA